MKTYKKSLKKAFFLVLTFTILILPAIFTPSANKNLPSDIEQKEIGKKEIKAGIDIKEILNSKEFNSLPVGSVMENPAENSWATAVFLPQTHQQPASAISSQVNDDAEQIQNEIYEILSYLSKYPDLRLIMTEGELYGQVEDEKIKKLSEKIALRDSFAVQAEELKSLIKESSNVIDYKIFSKDSENFIKLLDREIILAGASHVLKTKNKGIVLFGSETKNTQDESAKIVRKYIYLKDRKDQLEGTNNSSQVLASLKSLQLLSLQQTPENLIADDINDMSNCSNLKLKEEAGDLNAIYKEIQKNRLEKASPSAPSRKNNPYNSVRSVDAINSLLKETEKDINNVIIEKRNKETAENFAQSLKENNLSQGIIQFGAGHEEGLVKELNKLGINVITVNSKNQARK